MSQENLTACIDNIKAITSDETLSPSSPISIYLQEAEDTFHWVLEDLPLLSTIGITEEKRLNLNVRTGACRETQSLWKKDHRSTKDAEKQWLTKENAQGWANAVQSCRATGNLNEVIKHVNLTQENADLIIKEAQYV